MPIRIPGRPLLSTAPPIVERPGRVLVVEPNAERREALRELFLPDGYECVMLAGGDDLLRLYAEFEPDLLLIAVELPDGSGLELCGDVRAADPTRHVPTILTSDGADQRAVAAGLLAGADDFISDFSRLHEIRARVHVQLRNKRLSDALQRVRNERDLLRRDVQVDVLTGLLNRRALEASVAERSSARERFGVLFMDLDHFKSVNDRYGHEMGDRVLIAVSHVLRTALRPGDLVARYGGEEFVALIAGAGPESARLVAERLRLSVEEMPQLSLGPSCITLSIGAAVFDPERCEEAQVDLFRRADVALYAAKHSGRNRVVLASAEFGEAEAPGYTPSLLPSPETPRSRVGAARQR
jgi:two-component system cell cycle response regulator